VLLALQACICLHGDGRCKSLIREWRDVVLALQIQNKINGMLTNG